MFLTSVASGQEPTCLGGTGDNSILVLPLEREFEAKPLNFAFCAKKLGSWMFLLTQKGLGTQSRGSTGRTGALWLRIPSPSQGAARAEQRGGHMYGGCSVCNLWLAGKRLLPFSRSPRSPVQTFACPWSETDTWIFQHNLENPGSSNHTPMDQESQSSNGRKRTLNLRIVFALKLKLLSPGSLPPPRLPSFHLLCPKSDLKGQI